MTKTGRRPDPSATYPIVKRRSVTVSPRARGASGRVKNRQKFRQEIVDLHQAIFRRNQERINQSVFGYTEAFRRYEREYERAVRTYQRRASFEELDQALDRSHIAYVGDYHTLKQAQRSFVRLLRRMPPDRPVTLALEFIQGKHQKLLDGYLSGELSEEVFLAGIEHRSHWVFGGWPSFKPIFELARQRGYRIIGIDSMGRSEGGGSLHSRDRYAANRIVKAIRERPDALVLVLIGELHISPDHLPARVDEALGAKGPARERLIVYQNCQEIYWQLARRGLEHEVELVRVAQGQYCLLNTPPIIAQQSFLNWLELDDEATGLDAPEESFKEYARLVASFFDLDLGDSLEEIEVATVVDLSFLQRLQRRGDFSASEMRLVRRQILNSESYFIPRAKMAYLGKLSINHAAEEATHYLRYVCSGSLEPRYLVDAFYARALEEAIGFLGSKLINHKRKATDVAGLERLLAARTSSDWEKKLARLALRHMHMEMGRRVRGMNEVYESDARTFDAITHLLGYRMGERLYYGLVGGHIDKKTIRDLFFDRFEDEGAALTTYLYLATRIREVQTPERL